MPEKKNKLKEMQETCKLRFSTSVPLSVLKKIGEKIIYRKSLKLLLDRSYIFYNYKKRKGSKRVPTKIRVT